MTTISKHQETSIAKLNQNHDQQYNDKLSLVRTNLIQKQEQKTDLALTEINEELANKVEKKKRKAKADVEKDAKKDQVASSSRVANQTVVSEKQAPVLKAPERQFEQETEALDPEKTAEDLDKSIAKETNFIGVFAKLSTEAIRTGQSMFQFDWNESSCDWQNQVAHASVIQSAMEASGDAQAAATNEQAYRSKYDGIINVSMAGLSLLIGLGGAAKEAYEGEKQAAGKIAAEAKDLSSGASEAAEAEQVEAQAANNAENEVSKDVNNASNEASVKDKAQDSQFWKDQERTAEQNAKAESRVAGAKSGSGASGDKAIDDNARAAAAEKGLSTAGKVMKGVYEGFVKAGQIGMPLSMMAQGSCGVGVDAPSQSREANDQRDAAYAQANSEALQLHASGYGEHYNKTEDARQSVSAAIKFFTDEFQSLPGTIVQALGTYHV